MTRGAAPAEDELDHYIRVTKATDPGFALALEVGAVEDQMYADMRRLFPNGDRAVQAQWASDMAPTIHRYIQNAKNGGGGGG